MRNTKLHGLLQLFASQDWGKCSKFIASEYFNTSQELINLWQFLKKHRRKVSDNPDYFSKVRLYRALGRRPAARRELTKEEDGELRRWQYRLCKKIEQYFFQRSFEEDTFLQALAEVRAWRRRNDQPKMLELADDFQKKMDEKAVQSEWDWALSFAIQEERFLYHYQPGAKRHSGEVDPILLMMENSEKWFLLVQLRAWAELLGRGKVYNEKKRSADDPLLEWVVERAERYEATEPLIHLFRNILLIHLGNLHDPLLQQTVSIFRQCTTFITPTERNTCIRMMANYAIQMVRNGDDDYHRVAHQVYVIGFQLDSLILRGVIEPALFINICIEAIAVQDYSFAKKVIAAYEPFLPEEEAGLTVALCKAYIAFHQGDFRTTFDLLFNRETGSSHFQLRIRGLVLRALYYLMETTPRLGEVFYNKAQNFRTYLSRDEVVDTPKAVMYRNFISRIRELAKMRSDPEYSPTGYRIEAFREKLSEKPPALLSWLEQELDRLPDL